MLIPPTDEIRRSEHPPRGPEVPTQEFDEQRILDQLREPIAPLGGAGDGTNGRPVVLTIEDYRFDLAARVFVDGNDREVPLTRAEFALLVVFTRSPRQVLSRDQLRRCVVGRGGGADDRSIDMLVARLRRKIEPDPKAPRFIISVPGVGYKFAVRPQIADHRNALVAREPFATVASLGDHTPAQAHSAEPETPKFAVCVRLHGVEERTALPLTPRMARMLAFEACNRNQKICELAGNLLRMAAEKGLVDQLLEG
jgi:DNA-binding winged helix-turn-helix (wHTH) protein